MKKIATALLSCALAAATLAGCAANAAQVPQESQEPHTAALTATAAASVKSPKYVFLFIGDGMSYPQIQSTSDYLGALKDADYWQAQPSLDDNQGAILDGLSVRAWAAEPIIFFNADFTLQLFWT